MKTPTSFKLGAHTWRVKIVKQLVDGSQHLYGICHMDENRIEIARTVNGRELSEDSIFQTFLHEFVHAALYILGRDDNEELAAGFEQMLYQLHKTAKYPKTASLAHDKAS